ncbi:hypothetical protein PG993_007275 [Apiospora rasikravindrae]|uniref:UDP-N-acetylglucosamine transferase subunit ALG14 n=1 Tax=Apiospora rasikravindrae TaxID=990691 RepID=A0ABR1SX14_9PEZI
MTDRSLLPSRDSSREVQSASTASTRVEAENDIRQRHNNQSSQSQPSAKPSTPITQEGSLTADGTNSTPASTEWANGDSIESSLSFFVWLCHAMFHVTAIGALYLGTGLMAYISGALFMYFLMNHSSKLSESEARNRAPLNRIDLSVPRISVAIIWLFLLRHKSLVVCGNQPLGIEHRIENGFRLYFAGSGGHTGELLQMLTNSPPTDNIHRIWVICHGDETSLQKILDWEAKRKLGMSLVSGYEIVTIRRARAVHQPWATVPVSAIQCAYDISKVLNRGYPYRGAQGNGKEPRSNHMPDKGYPQVIVTNGPGTGLIIAGVAWLMKMLWRLPANSCKVLFIESIARVKTLSLTGKLFYYTGIATNIVVQHAAVGRAYNLKVEEMLTARELSNPGGSLFPGFSGVH